MRTSTLLLASLQALTAVAYPLTAESNVETRQASELPKTTEVKDYNWKEGYVAEWPIHSSCNATERHELTEGLRQAVEMAEQAKNHILVHGKSSKIYQKYFGDSPTAVPAGWFDKVASGNRAGVLFRCDDPDRNCATQDNWAGHWRGANGTSETVICPRSYLTRLPNVALCARGFTVSRGRPADFWGPDLLHRLYHTELIGEGIVEHYADGYKGVQELAAGNNNTWAGHNSATLTYFATEVYAYDVALPGEGCVGKEDSTATSGGSGHGAAPASSAAASASKSVTSAASAAASATVNPTRVVQTSTPTAGASKECHTHADGVVHCV